MTTQDQVLAAMVPCTILTSDGKPCGRPGAIGLPAGVCQHHAIAIYRAVVKLAESTRG